MFLTYNLKVKNNGSLYYFVPLNYKNEQKVHFILYFFAPGSRSGSTEVIESESNSDP
jgi:hypothetical protein